MRKNQKARLDLQGYALIETAISLGILAIVIPLMAAVIAESSLGILAMKTDTRSSGLVSQGLKKYQTHRDSTRQVDFEKAPQALSFQSYAFTLEGELLGEIELELYQQGVRQFQGKPVHYLVSIQELKPNSPSHEMVSLKITVESPAVSPHRFRRKIDFYTLIAS